jgi:diguanylate cyclase (GGDEF)-like protein
MSDVAHSAEVGAPGWWRRLWRVPDPVMLDAGASGEHLVAYVRVLATGLILLVPIGNLILEPEQPEQRIGFAVAFVAFVLALLVWFAVRRNHRPRWLGLVCTVFDVTLVSAALLSYVFTSQQLVATNSRVVFECYFLAIAATCLRHDVRLCLLAGALAVAQYLAVAWYASTTVDLNSLTPLVLRYGEFEWSSQISRAILLAIASFICSVIVLRTRDLRRLSALDRMTGLFNRGHFDDRLAIELNRAQRSRAPLSLVMMDVDRFKEFNDRYGHSAGDVGLKTIAERVKQMTRRHDIVARYGGEEFVLLLPDTTAEQALDKLEQIRAAVEELPIVLPKGQGEAFLTVSAGIAMYPADGLVQDELLDEADARLFRAKANGRNRVVGRPAIGARELGRPA